MSRGRQGVRLGAVAALALWLPACASIPQHQSGYLRSYSDLEAGKHFKQQYVAPGVTFDQYRSVKITPVELGFLEQQDTYTTEELNRLTARFQKELEAEMGTSHRILSKGDPPDERTLIVSPALISLTTPWRFTNLITTLVIWVPISWGSTTFEAKLLDGATRRVVARVAEKRSGGGFDLKSLLIGSYLKFHDVEVAFRKWAKQLAKLVAHGAAQAAVP